MQLITNSSKLSKVFLKLLRDCEVVHMAVAWASVGFPEYDAVLAAKAKIGRVVVGTHFYQTAPDFIERFGGNKRVRFVTDHSGVFHPKLYVFENQGGWACILGSANFTSGGFGGNEEACLVVTQDDDRAGKVKITALEAIERYWRSAVPGTDIDLTRYRKMRERFARPLAYASGQFGSGKPGRALEDVSVLNLSWSEFLAKVTTVRSINE